MKIAILGASANRDKFGNKAVRAYKEQGHDVFPVNPKEEMIEGLSCYSSLSAIDSDLDAVSLYLPPAITLKLVDHIISKKPQKVYINPGTEDDMLEKQLKDAGIEVLRQCSIVAIGVNPSDL